KLKVIYYILHNYVKHLNLFSFPTRRSSDLCCSCSSSQIVIPNFFAWSNFDPAASPAMTISVFLLTLPVTEPPITSIFSFASLRRSEEHTSELKSRFDLVCRVLLDKKKLNNL